MKFGLSRNADNPGRHGRFATIDEVDTQGHVERKSRDFISYTPNQLFLVCDV